MKRRVVGLLLVGVMIIGMLSGCGSTEESTSGTETSTSTEEVAEEVEEAAVVFDTVASLGDVYPITEELTELNIMVLQDALVEDFATNDLTYEYEEKTNIHVNWEVVPQSGSSEKLNLVLGTSEGLPDVFWNMSLSSTQIVSYGMDQGTLVDLAPYIEQYAPNVQAMFDYNPMIEQMVTTSDGAIYTLPKVQENYYVTSPQKAWIYQPWLDELGLELPTTTEELKEVLIAFTTLDPNGNGVADEIGITGATSGWKTSLVDYLMLGFVYDDQAKKWIVDEEGNVSVPYDTDEWRQGLEYMNSLYEDGLFDAQAFTQDATQLKQSVASEDVIAGIIAGGAKTSFMNITDERFDDYVALPPMEGPNGDTYAVTNPMNATIGYFAVTTECDDPIAALRWIDYFYSEAGVLRSSCGVEGVEWQYADEGVLGYNGIQAVYQKILSYGSLQNVHYNTTGNAFYPDLLRNGQADPEGTVSQEVELYNATVEYYEPYKVENVMWPIFMSIEEAEEVAEYEYLISDLTSGYVVESYCKFILGDLDILDDVAWSTYLQDLDDMGLQRYIEIYDTNYKAQYMN